MRRKPSSQSNGGGYNNQQRKQRYQQGGGSQGGQQQHSGNRQRKNYPALREKYLSQARDALAAGDRVLAENYFQHADHCYRMMMEEGQQRPNQPQQQRSQNSEPGQEHMQAEGGNEQFEPEQENTSSSALPAFLTAGYEEPAKPAEPVIVQNWEE